MTEREMQNLSEVAAEVSMPKAQVIRILLRSGINQHHHARRSEQPPKSNSDLEKG